jgi:prepilin-type N-terminal cleavage/methylation domain-containing protein
MNDRTAVPMDRQTGFTLVEMLFVVVVLSIGILAGVKLFPMAAHQQMRDRMRTAANYHAQDAVETLRAAGINDASLSDGRHPAGNATEAVGPSGKWRRYYEVTSMSDPLPNLKRVSVYVFWTTASGSDTLVVTTYLGR